jgi:SAM-dependent methyltransferase
VSDFLRESQALWDRYAIRNPLWAILSDPAKRDRQWDTTRFFQTGISEISSLLYELSARKVVVRDQLALDFGCGVGRLTQALASHFKQVVGVDISPVMIDIARSFNRFSERVTYVVVGGSDFSPIRDARFDFIVTRITLQHIVPNLSLQYVSALCRSLSTGGVLVFQLPSHKREQPERCSPPSVGLMPDEAYRAAIAFQNVKDGTLKPGARITLNLQIVNLSAFAWSQRDFGRMTVGNHWLDGSGRRMLVRDDGRTGIPERVQACETCRVPLTITLPTEPGDYQCEVDLSHEGLLWFHDKGSAVERVAVQVNPTNVTLAEPRPLFELIEDVAAKEDWRAMGGLPVTGAELADVEPFPMYGVRQEAALDMVAQSGAEVIDVQDDRSCGDDWVSYQYFVRKPA